jgi:hypothetical protein
MWQLSGVFILQTQLTQNFLNKPENRGAGVFPHPSFRGYLRNYAEGEFLKKKRHTAATNHHDAFVCQL